MSRAILDKVVQDKAMTASVYLDIMSNVAYVGDVNTNKPKVTLDSSKFGLGTEPITTQLEAKYTAMKMFEDGEILFELNGETKSIKATGKQIAMLKALAIEQINLCSEYSSIVADMFWQLLRKIAFNEGGEMPFKIPVDASRLRSTVVGRYSELILNQVLGGKE